MSAMPQIRHQRIQFLKLTCLLLCVGFLFGGVLRVAYAENIDAYTVNLEITPDSELKVDERIAYNFTSSKHGIYRCIPRLHHEQPSSFLYERYLDIELHSVMLDSENVPYEIDESRTEICIKIGDPNTTIAGAHLYTISYSVFGAISYSPYAGSELYWNATGDAWSVPIKQAQVTVRGANGLLLPGQACYRGREGESASCAERSFDGSQSVFAVSNLGIGEGITVAQAIDQTKIIRDVRERMKLIFILLFGIPILVILGAVVLYRSYTKYQTGKPIIPQYEPFPGVKPMYMGALFDGRLDPRDISAGIVYLAERGYIKIRKTEKKVLFFFEVDDYELTVTKEIDEHTLIANEGLFEAQLMGILFARRNTLKEDGTHLWREDTKILLSELKDAYSERNSSSVKMAKLKKDVEADLIKRGFFQPLITVDPNTFLGEMLRKVPAFIFVMMLYVVSAISFWVTMILCFGILIFAIVHKRRTRKGYEALDHLKGFKEFLSVTETHRYIFHNAPHRNAEQFMEFLPYAVAFGVEKEWAKVFEGVTIENPTWYDGGGTSPTFNSLSLTNSLSGFSSSFASAAFQSQGGGGGGFGSSGGGFSGGGSGGGGGGSW